MRRVALATALTLIGSAAVAAPAIVEVSISPKLQEKARKDYGIHEVSRLADHLRLDVERALARTGTHEDARVELTLVDAIPNRPTFKQLGDRPGLSMSSFGVGGARIEGKVIAADGSVTPVSYKYYETDIRYAWGAWTWADAETTFDRFARRLSRGETLASR